MGQVGYLAALGLGLLFAVAGVTKLRAPRTTRSTFAALGLPAPDVLARLVPAAELSLAVALATVPLVGGAAALVALGAFSVVLARALQAGVAVSCGCLGSAGDEPVSFVELVRNALLAVAAVAAVFAPGPVAPGLEHVLVASTAAAIGVMVLALAGLKRDIGSVWDNTLAGEAN